MFYLLRGNSIAHDQALPDDNVGVSEQGRKKKTQQNMPGLRYVNDEGQIRYLKKKITCIDEHN